MASESIQHRAERRKPNASISRGSDMNILQPHTFFVNLAIRLAQNSYDLWLDKGSWCRWGALASRRDEEQLIQVAMAFCSFL